MALTSAAERQKTAEERARELLLAHLDDKQRAEFERDRSFVVEVRVRQRALKPRTRRFRLGLGGAHELEEKNDSRMRHWCIGARRTLTGYFPADDTTLALKLLIETDLNEFERIAVG